MALSFGFGESAELLEQYRQADGEHWLTAKPTTNMAKYLNVLTQSTKFVIGPDNIILFRGGYGRSGEDSWRRRLDGLVN